MPRNMADRPLILWEEVRRGGKDQCEVENQKEDRSYYPKEVSGLQYDRANFWVHGDNCV